MSARMPVTGVCKDVAAEAVYWSDSEGQAAERLRVLRAPAPATIGPGRWVPCLGWREGRPEAEWRRER